ncbi:unnamed protein product, partial [Meganyctiphanes norvegica]
VIEKGAFISSYETAKNVTLVNNNIHSFPMEELFSFTNITRLDLSLNPLDAIDANQFQNLETLEYIFLYNVTSNISGTFQNLPNLKELHLEVNNLNHIPSGFCKTGSPTIELVGLMSNDITNILPDTFDAVNGLGIFLEDNSLSSIEEATWRPLLEAGVFLGAYFNPLDCGCEIAWMLQEGSQDMLNHVTAICSDGQNIHSLDPSNYEEC